MDHSVAVRVREPKAVLDQARLLPQQRRPSVSRPRGCGVRCTGSCPRSTHRVGSSDGIIIKPFASSSVNLSAHEPARPHPVSPGRAPAARAAGPVASHRWRTRRSADTSARARSCRGSARQRSKRTQVRRGKLHHGRQGSSITRTARQSAQPFGRSRADRELPTC